MNSQLWKAANMKSSTVIVFGLLVGVASAVSPIRYEPPRNHVGGFSGGQRFGGVSGGSFGSSFRGSHGGRVLGGSSGGYGQGGSNGGSSQPWPTPGVIVVAYGGEIDLNQLAGREVDFGFLTGGGSLGGRSIGITGGSGSFGGSNNNRYEGAPANDRSVFTISRPSGSYGIPF